MCWASLSAARGGPRHGATGRSGPGRGARGSRRSTNAGDRRAADPAGRQQPVGQPRRPPRPGARRAGARVPRAGSGRPRARRPQPRPDGGRARAGGRPRDRQRRRARPPGAAPPPRRPRRSRGGHGPPAAGGGLPGRPGAGPGRGTPAVTTGPHPPTGDAGREAEALRALPGGPATTERVLTELADVLVAHEELRTAEEEMRVQQEQISTLLLQYDSERQWRGRMASLVPVGLCVTDGNGTLVEVNPALAVHLGAGVHRLRGKPLAVYLAREDVRAFRTALRALTQGTATEQRLVVGLRPRSLPPGRTYLFGFPEVADHRPRVARVQWILVPEDTGGPPPPGPTAPPPRPVRRNLPTATTPTPAIPARDVIALATALAELSALPVGESDRQRLLGQMAGVVRGGGPGAEWASITQGPPMTPERLGSDSTQAQDFDGRQVQAGEGPSDEAYTSGALVTADDVTTDHRWPTLARNAAAGGGGQVPGGPGPGGATGPPAA